MTISHARLYYLDFSSGEIDKKRDCVNLGPLAVDPKYQGKGYGRSLLEELEGLASTQELDCVSCRTDVKVR